MVGFGVGLVVKGLFGVVSCGFIFERNCDKCLECKGFEVYINKLKEKY